MFPEIPNFFSKYLEKWEYFSVSDTDILGERNSEFSQLESNLQPSDY